MAFEEILPSSSSALSSSGRKDVRYDVFINHRGPDTKDSLAYPIYDALRRKGLQTFLDKPELELGDSFPSEIQRAMHTSFLLIAIFSPKYADSPWCLAELAFMLKTGNRIIPLFYNVHPSDLRWVSKGKGAYAKSFSEHEATGRYPSQILEDWKQALEKTSLLNSYIVENDNEGTLLKTIIEKAVEMQKKVTLEIPKDPDSTITEASSWNYVQTNMNGGGGGSPWDDGINTGIRQIIVRFGVVINSIAVEYDREGQSVWSKRRGGNGGHNMEKVLFDYPNEVLVSICGKYYKIGDDTVVVSLTFHTSHKTYGPFGNSRGHDFITPSRGCKVLGFYGRRGRYLDAIGVHLVMGHL